MSASTIAPEPEAFTYVEDIMSKNIVKIGADKSIQDVANMMIERNISSILLEDSGKIIGNTNTARFGKECVCKRSVSK